MAIAFSYGRLFRVPTRTQLALIQRKSVAVVPVVTRPTVTAIPAPVPFIAPVLRSDPPYVPLITPVSAPAPVLVAAQPAPVTVTTGVEETKPCSDCGGKVTDVQPAPAPAPAVSANVVAADAPAAPAPAPSSPAAPAKAKAGNGWMLGLVVVGVITAGLALAAFVRPRK